MGRVGLHQGVLAVSRHRRTRRCLKQLLLADFTAAGGSDDVITGKSDEVIITLLMRLRRQRWFLERKLLHTPGPERYSFARIARDWPPGSPQCKAHFGFELEHLREMRELLEIPDHINVGGKQRWSYFGDEALLIMLRRLCSSGLTLMRLEWEAGRYEGQLSRIVNWMYDHIYFTFAHLRDSRSVEGWSSAFETFAASFHRAGLPLKNNVLLLDGKVQHTSKPTVYEDIFFSGFKRHHGVKWLVLTLPNGIMPMPFGPVAASHNDGYLLKRSGLESSYPYAFELSSRLCDSFIRLDT